MKAKDLHILDDAPRKSWVPDYAKGKADLWTPKLVLPALVEAKRVLSRMEGRIGPAGDAAAWPEYEIEPADFAEQVIAKTYRHHGERIRLGATFEQIERVEIVYGLRNPAGAADNWLAHLERDERRVMLIWLGAVLSRTPIASACRARKIAYTTFLSRLERAAGRIAVRMNDAKEPVWTAAPLPPQRRSKRADPAREQTKFPLPRAIAPAANGADGDGRT